MAGTGVPRRSTSTAVAVLDRRAATKARAMPCSSIGREVAAGDRAGRLAVDQHRPGRRGAGGGPRRTSPRRRRATPRSCSAASASRPRKSPLSHATTQPSPACSGVMPGPSSWPCSGRPASSRSVSRAPSPAGAKPGAEHRVPQRRRPRRPARPPRRRPRPCSRCRRPTQRHALPRRPRPRGSRPTAAASGATAARRAPGRRALHGEHGPLGGDVRRRRGRRRTRVGVRGVGHDVEALVVDPPHDDVVEHRAVGLVEQVRVLRPARADLAAGRWSAPPAGGRGRRRRSTRTVPRWLTSNATAPVAAGPVLGQRAVGVRQRHLPAAEGDHAWPRGRGGAASRGERPSALRPTPVCADGSAGTGRAEQAQRLGRRARRVGRRARAARAARPYFTSRSR